MTSVITNDLQRKKKKKSNSKIKVLCGDSHQKQHSLLTITCACVRALRACVRACIRTFASVDVLKPECSLYHVGSRDPTRAVSQYLYPLSYLASPYLTLKNNSRQLCVADSIRRLHRPVPTRLKEQRMVVTRRILYQVLQAGRCFPILLQESIP